MEESIKKLMRKEVHQCYRGSRTTTLGGKVMISNDGRIVVVTSSTSNQTININWFMRELDDRGGVSYNPLGMIKGVVTKGDSGVHIALSGSGNTLAVSCVEDGKRGISIYEMYTEDDQHYVPKISRIKADGLITRRYGESLVVSDDGDRIVFTAMLTNGFIVVYSYFKVVNGYSLSYRTTPTNIVIPINEGGNPTIKLKGKTSIEDITVTGFGFNNKIPDYSAKVVMDKEGKFICVLINRMNEPGNVELVMLTYMVELSHRYKLIDSVAVADNVSVNDVNIVMDKLGNKVVITIPDRNTIYSLMFNDGELDHERTRCLTLDTHFNRCGDSIAISGDGSVLCIGEAGTLEKNPIYYINYWDGYQWNLKSTLDGSSSSFRVFSNSSVALDYYGLTIVTGEKGSNTFRKDGTLAMGAINITNL